MLRVRGLPAKPVAAGCVLACCNFTIFPASAARRMSVGCKRQLDAAGALHTYLSSTQELCRSLRLAYNPPNPFKFGMTSHGHQRCKCTSVGFFGIHHLFKQI